MKPAICMGSFILVFMAVLLAASATGTAGLAAIEEQSSCPATGCASGACHGYDDVPAPDGIALLRCPRKDCASSECHAWDTLVDRYHQPSDASLNAWILFPVLLFVGLVVMAGRVKK